MGMQATALEVFCLFCDFLACNVEAFFNGLPLEEVRVEAFHKWLIDGIIINLEGRDEDNGDIDFDLKELVLDELQVFACDDEEIEGINFVEFVEKMLDINSSL